METVPIGDRPQYGPQDSSAARHDEKSFALYRLSAMMPIKGLQDNRFARRGISPVNHVRTRLIAKIALVLLSFGLLLPASVLQARELAGSSSSAKTVKTAVKKRHTTVTRRYSSSAARARRARLSRARATARVRQWREVMEPRYKVNDLG